MNITEASSKKFSYVITFQFTFIVSVSSNSSSFYNPFKATFLNNLKHYIYTRRKNINQNCFLSLKQFSLENRFHNNRKMSFVSFPLERLEFIALILSQCCRLFFHCYWLFLLRFYSAINERNDPDLEFFDTS